MVNFGFSFFKSFTSSFTDESMVVLIFISTTAFPLLLVNLNSNITTKVVDNPSPLCYGYTHNCNTVKPEHLKEGCPWPIFYKMISHCIYKSEKSLKTKSSTNNCKQVIKHHRSINWSIITKSITKRFQRESISLSMKEFFTRKEGLGCLFPMEHGNNCWRNGGKCLSKNTLSIWWKKRKSWK